MVKLRKTKFWDIFSAVSYFLLLLTVFTLVLVVAYVINRLPEILGIA